MQTSALRWGGNGGYVPSLYSAKLCFSFAFALLGLLLYSETVAAAPTDVDYDSALIIVDNFLAASGSPTLLRGRDNDTNGLFEEDQLGMLSAILAGGVGVSCLNSAMVNEIQNRYPSNVSRVVTDLTVRVNAQTVNIISALNDTQPGLGTATQHVIAGLMTVADNVTITFVNNLADSMAAIYLTNIGQSGSISSVQNQINFQAGNYYTYGDAPTEPNYLGAAGDVDADGRSNLAEYREGAIQRTREEWLQACCIDPPLRIVTVQGGGLKISGAADTFAVTVAGGTGTRTFQWRKGSATSYTVVSNTDTYAVPFLTTSHSGNYFAVISDARTTRTTPTSTLTVVYVPIYFAQQPQGGTRGTGQSFTFSVSVQGGAGPGPYQYTWKRNGVVVGPNSPTFTLTNLTLADAGTYTVSVTSNGGPDTITSQGAVLNVVASSFTITQNPTGGNKYVGQSHTLTVGVSGGSGSFTFEWKKNGATFGAPNSSSLVFASLQKSDAGSYTCTVRDNANPSIALTSEAAVLQVEDPLVITEQPSGAELYIGDTLSMRVTASGGFSPLQYQWKWNGIPILTQTSNTYTAIVYADYSGLFRCDVRDAVGSVLQSQEVSVQVYPPVEIETQPIGANLYNGDSHVFRVVASGGKGNLHYLWVKDGLFTSYPDTPTLFLTGLTESDSGTYSCIVSDDLSYTVESSPAELRVVPYPSITESPTSANVYVGQTHTFRVGVSGGAEPRTYQWLRDSTPIAGQTSATLTLGAVQPADAGSYACRIIDGFGALLVSNSAMLTVFLPVSITQQPQSLLIYEGAPAIFTVTAEGGMPPLHYQWYKDGAPLAGANTAELSLSQTRAADSGTYTCRVFDSGSSEATSSAASLTVFSPPAITIQPQGAERYVGQSYTFSISVEGGAPPLMYQWRKNGINIAAAREPALVIAALTANDAGTYDCVVQDALGTTLTSESATLHVFPAIEIVQQPIGAKKYTGESHTFSVRVNGGVHEPQYVWYKNGQVLEGADEADLILSDLVQSDAGTYTCLITDALGGGAQTVPAILEVADPLSFGQEPEDGYAYLGEYFTLTVTVGGGYPPYSYAWYKDGTPLSSAQTSSLQVYAVIDLAAGEYTCRVRDSLRAEIFSRSATRVVVPRISIVQGLQGANKRAGEGYTFRLLARPGYGDLHYEWRKNGVRLDAADAPELTLENLQPADAGWYTCVVRDEGRDSIESTPAYLSVEQVQEGEEGEGETPEAEAEFSHSADRDGNGCINLSELLRVIQFYNAGGLHCDAATEDGYAPGDGATACSPHSSDYNPQDWRISLSELLRLVQIYNGGGYTSCAGRSEDGFCLSPNGC